MSKSTNTQPIIIRTRTTADGMAVCVWSDGDLTDRLGRGFSRAKLSMTAALMVAEESTLATNNEVTAMIKAAAKLERASQLSPGALRAATFGRQGTTGGNHTPYSRTSAYRERIEHIRNCRALHCRICGN